MERRTTNRKLENFLYSLGIKPVAYSVLWDGMVQWVYEDTAAFQTAFEIFKQTKQNLAKKNV